MSWLLNCIKMMMLKLVLYYFLFLNSHVLLVIPFYHCCKWMLVSPLVHFDLISMWATKTQYLLAHFFYFKTFRHGQAQTFLWITKFQSGQVNPSLATKVCGSVCSNATMVQTFKIYNNFNMLRCHSYSLN